VGTFRACAALALIIIIGNAARGSPDELAIDGWEVARPGGKPVPGSALGFDAKQAEVVARARVDLPAPLASRSLALELEDVRWSARVLWDGNEVARGEGRIRCPLPPSGAGKHELVIHARDERAVALEPRALERGKGEPPLFLAPVGATRLHGLLGSARIVERAPVELATAFVLTPEGATPSLVLELASAEAVDADVAIAASGATVATARVKAGAGERARVEVAWPAAPRWAPDHPETAEVVATIASVTVARARLAARALSTRDGRIAIDGPRPFHLVSAPPGTAREAIDLAHALGATALATGGRRDDSWLDEVERAGLLILDEVGLVEDPAVHALDDERFWERLRADARAEVERARGRPSIVAWSVARAAVARGLASRPGALERLVRIASELRELDPTRPVASRLDDGRALGLDLSWSSEPDRAAVLALPPVAPPETARARVALAGLAGLDDPAAVARAHAHARARAAALARLAGAPGIDLGDAPPPSDRPELAAALAPVAVVALDTVPGAPRRLAVVSDLAAPASATLAWSIEPAVATPCTGTLAFDLAPGARTVEIDARAREAELPGRARLVWKLGVGSRAIEVHGSADFDAWPGELPAFDPARAVLVLDPSGSTAAIISEIGIRAEPAPDEPRDLAPGALLVVGESALDGDAPSRGRGAALIERARRSGAALVLRQETELPAGVAPPLDTSPVGPRALLVDDPLDPAVAGLEPRDLEPLRAAGAFPPPMFARPARADARAIVTAPFEDVAAVVAVEDGQGRVVLSQLPLAHAPRSLARVLLRNLIRSALAPLPPSRPLFARAKPAVVERLEALGLPPLPFDRDALLRASEPVVLVDDPATLSADDVGALGLAVFSGATLLARVRDDAALAGLRSLAVEGHVVKAKTGPRLVPGALRGTTQLDFLWKSATPNALEAQGAAVLVSPGALVERPLGRGRIVYDLLGPLDAPVAERAPSRLAAALLATLGARATEPTQRFPATAFGGVGRENDQIAFYSNGTARTRLVARRAGRLRIALEMRGTPCHESWPTAVVRIDGRIVRSILVPKRELATYELEADISPGNHQFSVSFEDDDFDGPENDKNLWMRGAVVEWMPRKMW
jgi:hypothetical protein